uniref:BRF2ral transcription factor IIIB subunit n=2 Tax=Cyanistes caeruleus TaxID=156563 RepID=A0A8C0UDF5_CYACU
MGTICSLLYARQDLFAGVYLSLQKELGLSVPALSLADLVTTHLNSFRLLQPSANVPAPFLEDKEKLLGRTMAIVELASETWLVTGRHPVPIVTAAAFLAWQSLRPGPRLSCPLARFCRLAGVDLPPPAHLRLKELLEILQGMASQLSWLRGFDLDKKTVVKHIGDLLQHRVFLLKNAFSQQDGEEQQDTAPGQGSPGQDPGGSLVKDSLDKDSPGQDPGGSPNKDSPDKDSQEGSPGQDPGGSSDKNSSGQDPVGSLDEDSLDKDSPGQDPGGSLDKDSPDKDSSGQDSPGQDPVGSPNKDSPDKDSPGQGSSGQDPGGSSDKDSLDKDSSDKDSPGQGSPSSPPVTQEQGCPSAGKPRRGGTLRPLLPPCLIHPRKRLRPVAPSAPASALTGDEPISDSEIEQYLRSPDEIRAFRKAKAWL